MVVILLRINYRVLTLNYIFFNKNGTILSVEGKQIGQKLPAKLPALNHLKYL